MYRCTRLSLLGQRRKFGRTQARSRDRRTTHRRHAQSDRCLKALAVTSQLQACKVQGLALIVQIFLTIHIVYAVSLERFILACLAGRGFSVESFCTYTVYVHSIPEPPQQQVPGILSFQKTIRETSILRKMANYVFRLISRSSKRSSISSDRLDSTSRQLSVSLCLLKQGRPQCSGSFQTIVNNTHKHVSQSSYPKHDDKQSVSKPSKAPSQTRNYRVPYLQSPQP